VLRRPPWHLHPGRANRPPWNGDPNHICALVEQPIDDVGWHVAFHYVPINDRSVACR